MGSDPSFRLRHSHWIGSMEKGGLKGIDGGEDDLGGRFDLKWKKEG